MLAQLQEHLQRRGVAIIYGRVGRCEPRSGPHIDGVRVIVTEHDATQPPQHLIVAWTDSGLALDGLMDDSPSFAIPTSRRMHPHPRIISLQPLDVLLYHRLPQPPLLFFVLSIHGDGTRVLAWQPRCRGSASAAAAGSQGWALFSSLIKRQSHYPRLVPRKSVSGCRMRHVIHALIRRWAGGIFSAVAARHLRHTITHAASTPSSHRRLRGPRTRGQPRLFIRGSRRASAISSASTPEA